MMGYKQKVLSKHPNAKYVRSMQLESVGEPCHVIINGMVRLAVASTPSGAWKNAWFNTTMPRATTHTYVRSDQPSFSLRLPPELKRVVERHAANRQLSLNEFIVMALTEVVAHGHEA